MKLVKACSLLLIMIMTIGGVYLYYQRYNTEALPSFISEHTTTKKYIIKKAGKIVESTDTEQQALEKASDIARSIVINTYNEQWVYTDLKPFFIINDDIIHDFDVFTEAVRYAKTNGYEEIYYQSPEKVIWRKDGTKLEKVVLNVPLILQNPELPRGCEVTSLAMIMKYAGISVDKMILAEKIKKENTPYIKENGRITCGNPAEGFVGDMYNKGKFGYGVYHEPVLELAKEYCGEQAVDLTGLEFEEVLYVLQQGYPIWIITNATYQSLDDSQFEIWHTPTGIVKATFRLHSVVITGMDQEHIYINDPLSSVVNRKLDMQKFKLAWEQMGNQAIAILN